MVAIAAVTVFAMNIFYIDTDPRRAARQHVDRHVVKMPIEAAQLLSTAHHVLDGPDAPSDIYRAAYANHPCAVWVREAAENYRWTYLYLCGLLEEYEFRYGRVHATCRLVPLLRRVPANLRSQGRMTPPAQAMPDEFKAPDALDAYRAYYSVGKAHLHRWKRRLPPPWITN